MNSEYLNCAAGAASSQRVRHLKGNRESDVCDTQPNVRLAYACVRHAIRTIADAGTKPAVRKGPIAATVDSIVRQNGGFVHVCSEPEHGATSRIDFPRLTRGAGAVFRVEDMQDEHCPPSGNAVILLVEDDQLVRNVTVDMLRFLGYDPIAARNALEAIGLCRNPDVQIDLLITDVVMPDMKGAELRDKVAEIRPDLPVLFTSGYTPNVIVRHGVLLQNVHFLQKPFSVEDLSAKIRELLGRSECPGSGLT